MVDIYGALGGIMFIFIVFYSKQARDRPFRLDGSALGDRIAAFLHIKMEGARSGTAATGSVQP